MEYDRFIDEMDKLQLRLFLRQSYVYNVSLQDERARYEKILTVLYDRWLEGDMTDKDWMPLTSLFKFFEKIDL